MLQHWQESNTHVSRVKILFPSSNQLLNLRRETNQLSSLFAIPFFQRILATYKAYLNFRVQRSGSSKEKSSVLEEQTWKKRIGEAIAKALSNNWSDQWQSDLDGDVKMRYY